MNGHVLDTEIRIASSELWQGFRFHKSIPSEKEDACSAAGGRGADILQRRLEGRLFLAPGVICDLDRGNIARPCGNDLLDDLGGVFEHKGPGGQGDPIYASEGASQVDRAVYTRNAGEGPSEFSAEIPHQADVRPREPVDRLPVVADREDARIVVLLLQRRKQP